MIPELYPPARAILRGDAPGRWALNGPFKIIWHTTETLGLPAYDNDNDDLDAELAPHLTYDPLRRIWYQDYKLTRPSESLRVHDDDMCIQIEIICYSDKRTVDRYQGGRLWVGDLPDTAFADLAAFVLWLEQYVNIPRTWPSPGRMSADEFHRYGGHAGHVHVPDNTHWDPGVFDYKKLFDYIKKGDNMRLPPERREDIIALTNKGVIIADPTYYFPQAGQPSADLPVDVWVNVTLAAIGGAARLGFLDQGEKRSAAEIRKIVADAIANG